MRKIQQLTSDKKFIRSYQSITEAANTLRCDEATIRKALDTPRLAKGFLWVQEKAEEVNPNLPEITPIKRNILVVGDLHAPF